MSMNQPPSRGVAADAAPLTDRREALDRDAERVTAALEEATDVDDPTLRRAIHELASVALDGIEARSALLEAKEQAADGNRTVAAEVSR